MSEPAPVEQLASWLANAQSVLAFTGAGISTGSGIPDFRGPQGVWKTWTPVYYNEFVAADEARVRHWEFKLHGWSVFRDARPNAAHLALVELEELGFLDVVVTQNIDGLHQKAGQAESRVIELHGTNLKVECITCGKLVDPDPIYRKFEATRKAPLCNCGGHLKPATVMFGQQMPLEKLGQAMAAAQACDLAISIGSTLEVEPAASVPGTAKRRGAHYVIVNLGPTAHDRWADLRLEADATEVLPAAVTCLRRLLDQ